MVYPKIPEKNPPMASPASSTVSETLFHTSTAVSAAHRPASTKLSATTAAPEVRLENISFLRAGTGQQLQLLRCPKM